MVRELGLCVVAAMSGGCSLILDFSQSQVPVDAEIDGPYTGDQCAYLEPNETRDTPMMVTPADMGPGAICAPPRDSGIADDLDFYKFNVAAGTTKVTISMMYTNRPGGDLDLKLFDPLEPDPMKFLSQSRGFTDTEKIVCPGTSPFCPALTAGSDYVFEVLPAISGQVNSYTFSIVFE
jgi:hypothetical protein